MKTKLHIRLQPFTLCGVWLYEKGDRWDDEQAILPHRVEAAMEEGDFILCEECQDNWRAHKACICAAENGEDIPCPCPYHEDTPMLIHLSDWASQPDIHVVCEDRWTTPSWGHPDLPSNPEPGIYLDDDGKYYTFTEEKVTCPDCKKSHKKDH